MGNISILDSCIAPFLILTDHGCHTLQAQFHQASSAMSIPVGVQKRPGAWQEQSIGEEKCLLLIEQALLCC